MAQYNIEKKLKELASSLTDAKHPFPKLRRGIPTKKDTFEFAEQSCKVPVAALRL